jgi:hypothetical protein
LSGALPFYALGFLSSRGGGFVKIALIVRCGFYLAKNNHPISPLVYLIFTPRGDENPFSTVVKYRQDRIRCYFEKKESGGGAFDRKANSIRRL